MEPRAAMSHHAVDNSEANKLKGIMLFGVRVMEAGSFRKCASMNNLAHYDVDLPHDSKADVAAGYASDDVVHLSARTRERKRGVPWTEEEHKLFLLGLQKVGKGDWRGISRNFVKTRTPTQVASHAQKYFLRRNNLNRRRRRSSLFDITTDTFKDSTMEESHPIHKNNNGIPVSIIPAMLSVNGTSSISMENLTLGQSIEAVTPSSKMADLDLNHTATTEPMAAFSLKISAASASSSSDQQLAGGRHGSGGFNNNSSGGDSIMSVAVA